MQYQKVCSFILFTRTTLHWEWVPTYSSPSAVGVKYAAWCMLFGWWSLAGPFLTPAAIVNNLLGGVNVTEFVAGPSPLPGQAGQGTARRELASLENRERYGILFMFILALLALVLWIALSPSWP